MAQEMEPAAPREVASRDTASSLAVLAGQLDLLLRGPEVAALDQALGQERRAEDTARPHPWRRPSSASRAAAAAAGTRPRRMIA